MDFLTKQQILDVEDIKTEEVAVPEWGGKVLVRGLTGTQRDAFEATIVNPNSTNGKRRQTHMNLANFRAKLVAACVVDPETGDRMFSDAEALRLGAKSAAALQRVFNVAAELSGINEDDVAELTKNSEGGPNGASGSGSH